jgi:hypothetical protein
MASKAIEIKRWELTPCLVNAMQWKKESPDIVIFTIISIKMKGREES